MGVELQVLWKLGVAFLLSSAVGLERELRQKSAGLRTHTLVGVGSALFTLVSQYGFAGMSDVELDPSRIAAQVVAGVGFLGAGIIFVRSDAVRGLTTAAAVWVTAAIGMAAGAGLPLLAAATTLIYFIVAYVYPHMVRALPQAAWASSLVNVTYLDGHGLLRDILARCTAAGFDVVDVSFRRPTGTTGAKAVGVDLRLRGPGRLSELLVALEEPDGVLSVEAGTTSDDDEE